MERNFRALETFRIIAAIFVALGHLFFWNQNFNTIPRSFILSVEFFFVLSGFVITLKLENQELRVDEYLNKLFLGRTIRLLVPYMILITFYHIVFIKILFNQKINLYNWIVNIFLLQIMGLNGKILGGVGIVAWALGLEYWIGTIYFPIIYFFKRNFNKGLFFISMILYIVCIGILHHYSTRFMDVHIWQYSGVPWGIIRILASYSIGTLCSILYQKFKNIEFKNKREVFTILEITIIYFIVRVYRLKHYDGENEYVFPIFAGILIFIFAYENGIISKALEKVSFLGKLSYSIYLIHPCFVELMNYLKVKNPLSGLNILYYIVLLLIMSFLFYYFVEKNIINLKYNLLNKNKNKELKTSV